MVYIFDGDTGKWLYSSAETKLSFVCYMTELQNSKYDNYMRYNNI